MDKFVKYESPPLTYTYPSLINVAEGGVFPLTLITQMMFNITTVEEIGTYIIPIAYHRNIGDGVQVEQVLRSDASFWPMPKHAIWSEFEKIVSLSTTTALPPPEPPPPEPPPE
jgi:hypothetical protein